MFTWFDGHLILVMLLCPVVALLIGGGIQAWLNWRWRKACDADRARRLAGLRPPTTAEINPTMNVDIAAVNARQSAFYQRLDDEGRNDRADVTRPRDAE